MSRLGRVGPYTLLERLGRGGMGEVYLAGSRRGDNVALKVLHDAVDADSDARMRLEREVRALRRVESPYVARVLDADLDGDRPYLVMEHIQGDTLLERVRRDGPLAGGGLLALAHGLATALSVIHAAGVVHRDLKPTNVLVNPGDEPVLIDFGIAHVLDATRLTVTGTFLGTPGYAAPELFADEHVGEPADVHAWAATVTFAATGRPPFGRGPIEAQMYAILNGQADLEGVPAALLPLIRAALHREAAKRPTAALLASRLTRLVRAAPSGVGGAPERRPEGRSRRVRTRVADPARGRAGGVADDAPGTERAIPGREGASRGGRVGTAPEAEPRPGRPSAAAIETSRDGRSSAVAEGARNGRAAPPSGETSRGGRPVTAEGPRAGRTAAGGEAHRGGRSPAAEGEGSRGGRLPAAEGTRGRSASEGKPAGGHRGAREGRTTGVDTAPESGGRAGPLPAGNGALLLLALLAVPCVVATVIWPLATFAVTGVSAGLARAIWAGHRMVRKRASARVRMTLRVVTFPLVLAGSLLTVLFWPGIPAVALAALALWSALGGSFPQEWWTQPTPIAVAGVVCGLVSGGVLSREIERVGAALPALRKEGLRALAVLGGFVALCSAAVRAIAFLV